MNVIGSYGCTCSAGYDQSTDCRTLLNEQADDDDDDGGSNDFYVFLVALVLGIGLFFVGIAVCTRKRRARSSRLPYAGASNTSVVSWLSTGSVGSRGSVGSVGSVGSSEYRPPILSIKPKPAAMISKRLKPPSVSSIGNGVYENPSGVYENVM